jgi:hypothetical protein
VPGGEPWPAAAPGASRRRARPTRNGDSFEGKHKANKEELTGEVEGLVWVDSDGTRGHAGSRSSMRSLTTETADITRIGVNQTGAVPVVLPRLGSQEEKARPSHEHRPARWRETILRILRLVWTLDELAGVHVGQPAVGSLLLGIMFEFQTSNISSTRP